MTAKDREPRIEDNAGADTAGGGGNASASTSSTGSSGQDANGEPADKEDPAPES